MKEAGHGESENRIFRITLRIVSFYILIAGGWIFFSDTLIEHLAKSPEQLSRFQTYKGLLFVIVSGILLFSYIYGELKSRSVIEKRYENEVRLNYERMAKTLDSAIRSISKILETKDPYTQGHQERVTLLAVAIAGKMGLSEEETECLRISSMIHDIGKISLPSDILTKPGDLSELEYRMIQTHPKMGKDIVDEIDFPCPVAEIVSQHHERMDGSGYPYGLKGEKIHLCSRIIAVADVVETMSSNRPYRAAVGLDEALETISKDSGKLFDPHVVEACIDVFRKDGFTFEDNI